MLELQWLWYPGPMEGLSALQLKHVAAVTVVPVAMLVFVGVGMLLLEMQALSTALQIVPVAQVMTEKFRPKSHWRNMAVSEQ